MKSILLVLIGKEYPVSNERKGNHEIFLSELKTLGSSNFCFTGWVSQENSFFPNV